LIKETSYAPTKTSYVFTINKENSENCGPQRLSFSKSPGGSSVVISPTRENRAQLQVLNSYEERWWGVADESCIGAHKLKHTRSIRSSSSPSKLTKMR